MRGIKPPSTKQVLPRGKVQFRVCIQVGHGRIHQSDSIQKRARNARRVFFAGKTVSCNHCSIRRLRTANFGGSSSVPQPHLGAPQRVSRCELTSRQYYLPLGWGNGRGSQALFIAAAMESPCLLGGHEVSNSIIIYPNRDMLESV
ncbi:hypothetical protein CONPUDRAFT_85358 [Coniophora puteana RWD-64-598 SS2]|uniref:Uncharacterized protein n=1 Tax=Coniophora puteana (strain RWD-64-598) TaxID=741705 RepID=A0A5M3M8U5_CONPW|nr:uncharacterized protein CONPUDRAFT_85358 [Coniophora puteana RWD-64-598 SS2]EIW75629.1 hypothetical protein CONPUDRAFT_85358 [Coniophora puteana RWD-64-598 SS2]